MVPASTIFTGREMKRHRLLITSLSLIAGMAALTMAARAMQGAGPAGDAPCGLGLPPDAPGFARQKEERAAEAKKNGFLRVCEANLQRYSVTFLPLAVATHGLDFEPVDLRKTPFARLHSLGGRSERFSGAESRLYRGFRSAAGHTLTLFEHDMSADGTHMRRAPEDEPERINGLPARLVVLQADSGKAVSVLSWRQGRRYYELWIEANAARDPLRARLFELAGSLPLAVPACPEDSRKGAASGPGGSPFDDPPLSLSAEEMETSSKGACG